MLIEPHPKYEVIKDLVVDFDRPRETSGKADTR
jgi:succinate dehydrogenase/fumarate reductase-like Fe-S protein